MTDNQTTKWFQVSSADHFDFQGVKDAAQSLSIPVNEIIFVLERGSANNFKATEMAGALNTDSLSGPMITSLFGANCAEWVLGDKFSFVTKY